MKNKLTIISIFICGMNMTNFPEAIAQCTAGFTIDSTNAPTISFISTSTGATMAHYEWLFDNSTGSAMENPSTTYAYAGNYNVCLTYSDSINPCSSTICHNLVVTNAPNAPCSAHFYYIADSVTANHVGFYDQSIFQPVKWDWNFGDGASDTLQNTDHQYAATGTYYVCLAVINNNGDTCTFCDSVNTVSCFQRLNASYSYLVNNGGDVTFTSNCTGAYTPSYFWIFGDGGYSYDQNPFHIYPYNGAYEVQLYYADSGFCSKPFFDTVTITNASSYPCNAIFSYSANDSISGNTISFNDNSTQNIVNWSWSFGDGDSSSASNPFHTYSNTGTYNVCLNVTNQSGLSCNYCNTVNVGSNCNNTSALFTMAEDTIPHVYHVVNMSTGAGPVNYLWSWGDGTTSTGINPTHTYPTQAWYNICLTITDVNNCGSSYCIYDSLRETQSIISVYVTSPTSAGIDNDFSTDKEFSIYPNPNNGVFRVKTSEAKQFQLEIYNVLGEVVFQSIIYDSKSEIDLSSESKGIYFVRLKKQNAQITTIGKLIITN